MNRNKIFDALPSVIFCLGLLGLPEGAEGQAPVEPEQRFVRNFDARTEWNVGFRARPTAAGLAAASVFEQQVPGLMVRYDRTTGATRSISHRVGYLTGPLIGSSAHRDPTTVALEFVRDHRELLGLTEEDLADFEVTDTVFSQVTGATHLYLRQRYRDLPVYNGQLQVHVNRDGRILSVNNAFLPDIARAAASPRPTRDAGFAVQAAARHLGIPFGIAPHVLEQDLGPQRMTRLEQPEISTEVIEARLVWLPIRAGNARLVWNFQVSTTDHQHHYDITVDAHSGRLWTHFDWVASDDHRVFPIPLESPAHGPNPPPADGRTVVSNVADATASPSGWFDDGTARTITRGNNVNAYEDSNSTNSPSSGQPDCGATLVCEFDFPIDFGTQAPSTYRDAAVSNLFYWNNIIHDIQYLYGFDEAAGNFQEQNFGKGGVGGDSVNAEAQDGSGNCNANFLTPTDGGNPRMQMFNCTNVTPARDGDFDNGVIVHEYGHGISVRQVGGPSNSSCLNNAQQGGEGWSDWFALAYTAQAGDQGTDARGIGTYLFGQPPNGPGIRNLPYSTDPAVNNWTYESINGASVPHGVGSRWAQVLWEVYWALVDEYGFDADLYDVAAGAGNHRAMLYVNEGLKNTACSPTFVDARDGILQAAADNFGGADVCLLWEAFAAFGLGTDAVSGGSGSTSPTNGFSEPPECLCSPFPTADAGPDRLICSGESAMVGTPAQPDNTYLWAPGGQTTAQITVSPGVDTTYTVTATTTCDSVDDSATVFVDPVTGLSEDFEGDVSGWTATGLWHRVDDSPCPSPQPGYSSPTRAFYFGQDASCDYNAGTASGSLTSPLILGVEETSTLSFDYFRQVESFTGAFDKTEVQIVTDSGTDTIWSLNSSTASASAWVSSGPISLSNYAGRTLQVRFVFDSVDGVGNAFIGWLVDDVVVTAGELCCGTADLVLNHQTVTQTEAFEACKTITAGTNFQINSPGDVTFQAGERIILENGFSVGAGAKFRAVIATP